MGVIAENANGESPSSETTYSGVMATKPQSAPTVKRGNGTSETEIMLEVEELGFEESGYAEVTDYQVQKNLDKQWVDVPATETERGLKIDLVAPG